MPKGMVGVRDAVKDIEARKNSTGGGNRTWFRLGDGESAVVRFLEEGEQVKWAWCHEVPVEGRSWGRPVACRDQDEAGQQIGEACPGCEHGLKRKFQGWINLIWRDAPVYDREPGKDGRPGKMKKDAFGKPVQVGKADQIAVWQAGITVFEELDGKDVTYKGLTSRDFRVTRRGTGMNTKYNIEPANPDSGPVALNTADKKLEGEKHDFVEDVTPAPYAEWGKAPQQQEQAQRQFSPADVSPFAKRA